jgi:hypothetical protein
MPHDKLVKLRMDDAGRVTRREAPAPSGGWLRNLSPDGRYATMFQALWSELPQGRTATTATAGKSHFAGTRASIIDLDTMKPILARDFPNENNYGWRWESETVLNLIFYSGYRGGKRVPTGRYVIRITPGGSVSVEKIEGFPR